MEYSISFSIDAESGPHVEDISFRIGDGYTIAVVPYSIAWHSSKWNTSENGTGMDIISGDYVLDEEKIQSLFAAGTAITLHPKFVKNEYGIVFNANSGSGSVPDAICGKVLDSDISIPDVSLTRIGYSVNVWNTSENGTGIDVIPGDRILDDSMMSSLFSDRQNITLYPKWTKNEYSVSFDSNDGDGSVASITGITIGSALIIPGMGFTRTGYSASIWNTRSDGNGSDLSIGEHLADEAFIVTHYSESSSIVLYPKWTKKEYRIDFGANGGTGTVPDTIADKVIDYGIRIPSIALTRIGYSSAVWNSSIDGKGADIAPGDTVLDGELITSLFGEEVCVTLYPKWVKNTYSIIFDRNQGIGNVATIDGIMIDSEAVLSDIGFERIGYDAAVWNTGSDGEGTDLIPGGYHIDTDFITAYFVNGHSLTLYPKWVKNEYTVSFDSKTDSNVTIDGFTVRIGEAYTITDVPYSKDWHSSDRWNTSEDGTGTDIIPGDHVLDEATVQSLFSNGSDVILYPKWIKNEYSMIFNHNLGTGDVPASITGKVLDSDITIPSVCLSRIGYHVLVWNSSPDGTGHDVIPGEMVLDDNVLTDLFGSVSSVVDLYPKWVKNVYSVTFDSNSGSGSVPSIDSISIGDGFVLPSVGYSRIGYVSSVWNTASDGTGDDLSPGEYDLDGPMIESYICDSSVLTLYPRWYRTVYTVSFDSDFDKGRIPNDVTVSIDEEYVLPDVPFKRSWYHCDRWTASSDGTGTEMMPGRYLLDEAGIVSFFGIGTELTLRPVWVKNEYRILFDRNLGLGDTPASMSGMVLDSDISIPSVSLTRIGYEADVWNSSSDGNGTDVIPGDMILDDGLLSALFNDRSDVTLYPKWVGIEYSIVFNPNTGIGDVPSAIGGKVIDSKFSVPNPGLSRVGYHVSTWNSSSDGSGVDVSPGDKVLDEDLLISLFDGCRSVVLYPKWIVNEYRVLFDGNRGIGDISPIASIHICNQLTLPEIGFVRTGYEASVWNTKYDGSGIDISPGSHDVDDGLIVSYFGSMSFVTLYPKWTKVSYSISFNGGTDSDISIKDITITIDSGYEIPDVPFSKRWYSPSGWNTSYDGSGTDIFPGTYALNEAAIVLLFSQDMKLALYPKWIKNEYSITFDPNSGTGKAPKTITGKVLDSELTVPAVGLTRIGYGSQVWNTEPDGTGTDLAPGTHLLDDTMLSLFFGDDASIALYPKWTVRDYALTFDGNLGSGSIPDDITGLNIGDTLTVPSVQFSRVGYTQGQWNTRPDGSGLWLSSGKYDLSESTIPLFFGDSTELRLYATWTEINYDILFNPNGGSGTPMGSISVTVGRSVTIPDVGYSRTGYRAASWNTSDSGSGTVFEKGEIVWDEGLITSGVLSGTSLILYPDWVKIAYTIHFDANGGSGREYDDIVLTVGETFSLPELTVRMTGFTAVRWNTSSDGKGYFHGTQPLTFSEQTIGLLFTDDTVCTFYAEWVPVDYSVILHEDTVRMLCDGLNIGDTVTVPSAAADNRGYHCDRWDTSSQGNGTSIAFGELLLTGSFIEGNLNAGPELHLYPVWSPNEYAIVYDTDGGDGVDEMTYGANLCTPVEIRSEMPRSVGYSFRGWSIGGITLMPGDMYTMDISHVPDTGSIVLKAEWGIDITFAEGLHPGDVTLPADILMKGRSCKVSLTSPVSGDADWRFVGYACDPSGDVVYPAESMSSITFDRNTELTAVWSVPVAGDASGCRVSSAERAVAGKPWSMSIDIPRGYKLDVCSVIMGGIAISSDGTVCSAEKVIAPISYELSAVPEKYILALSTGSGTVSEDGWDTSILNGRRYYTMEFTVESDEIVLPDVLPGDRYTLFGGWADGVKSLGKGSVGNTAIDAVWVFREFSIETFVDGRSTSMGLTVRDEIPEPAAPAGYRFAGWEYVTDSGDKVSLSSMADIDDGMQLYASFEPIPDEPYELIAYPLIVIVLCLVTGYTVYRRT